MPLLFLDDEADPYVALDGNGNPIAGAQLFFYSAGTATEQAVYDAPDLLTPITQPVVADSAGEFVDIWFDAALDDYRARMLTADGKQIFDVDPYLFETVAPSRNTMRPPGVQALVAGVPQAAATMTFYTTATTDKLDIFADPNFETPLPNPISANAGGFFPPIYLNGTYAVLTSWAGTIDPVPSTGMVTIYLAVSDLLFDTDKDMMYSKDGGLTWTAISTGAGGAGDWFDVAYGNGRWVAVGRGGEVAYSTDGELAIWTDGVSGTFDNLQRIVYMPTLDRWVMCMDDATNDTAYSDDGGATWTLTNSGITGSAFVRAMGIDPVTERVFVGALGGTNNLAYSDDGINWTPTSFGVGSSSVYEIAADGTGDVVTGDRGDLGAWYSVDSGVNALDIANLGVGGGVTALIWDGTQFVAAAAGGEIATALSAGISFSQVDDINTNSLEFIVYDAAIGRYMGINSLREIWTATVLTAWANDGVMPTGGTSADWNEAKAGLAAVSIP